MRLLSTEYSARSGRGVAPSWVVLALVLLALFAVLLGKAMGADVTAGHTFVNGETVTADSMNAIAGSAVINSGFYTTKASQSTVADADVLLLYSPSLAGFRQMTWARLILTNSELVNVLFATTDAARRSNFLAGADSGTISNFVAGASTPVRSNFFIGAWSSLLPSVTNSQATYSPTNAGAFAPWWDSTNHAWASLQWPVRYTSPAFTWAAGLVTNLAHSLPGTPQQARWVLSCTAANGAGLAIGDEIPVESVFSYTTNQVVGAGLFNQAGPAFTWGVNSTNVYIRSYTNAALAFNFVVNSAGSGNIPITNANFKLKAYATYWP